MIAAVPTESGLAKLRLADFDTLPQALDYAARGRTGLNFYSARKGLVDVLSYADLRRRARALAGRLLGNGLAPGDMVAMVAETDADFVCAFMGCQYAGLVPAPLPLPAAFGGKDNYIGHIRRIVRSCGARALFSTGEVDSWITEAAHGLDLVFAGLLDAFPGGDENLPRLPEPDPGGLAYLQFSSGTTRFPKGVAVTQRAFMANARAIARHGLALRPGDRACSWLPLYHDMGLVGFLLAPMAAQVTIDMLPTRDFARRPLMWLRLISEHKATISYSPSFGYALCTRRARTADTSDIDLSSWRAAGIGGDMIRVPVLDEFSQCFAPNGFDPRAFVSSYGMAEATLALSFAPLNRGIETEELDLVRLDRDGIAVAPRLANGQPANPSRSFVLCGPPLPGHEIEIRVPEGAPPPDGRVGRIFARGPSLMQEYLGNPTETAEVLSPDGWLDTGDLGFMRDGQLVITGRDKDLMLVNGRNIWPQDLEWAAENGPGGLRSGDVAAFSVENRDTDREEVVLLVQCRIADHGRREALLTSIQGLIRETHGIEALVVAVPPHSLPQTSSGKLSRVKAKRLYLDNGFGR